MGASQQAEASKVTTYHYPNVVIFGLDRSGKTHFLYSGLVGSKATHDIQPTTGFNVEQYVGESSTFNIWDISGQQELIEFWPKYC